MDGLYEWQRGTVGGREERDELGNGYWESSMGGDIKKSLVNK